MRTPRPIVTTRLYLLPALLAMAGGDVATAQQRADSAIAISRAALGKELRDSLTRVLVDAVENRAFPGAYAVVGDSRGVLAEYGVGRLDWRDSPRPTRRTLWDLASLTKVVATTTALAQLVERGLVRLDDPVQRHVPEWVGAGKDAVTVRHLLSHTSGLPAFREYDKQTHDRDSLAALLFNTELERAAGEKMVYSDIGAFMMGVVVERASHMPLQQYVARHVLHLLGMRETTFRPSRALRSRIAPTEHDSTRGGLLRGVVHDERAYYLGGVAAHAGLFGSASDISRFARMMLNRGALDGISILRVSTVDSFTTYVDSTRSNRALGWQKPERPDMRDRTPASAWAGRYMSSRSFGHTGFTGTSIAVDPELDLFIVLLSNRVNPTRDNPRITEVRSRLADAVVAAVRRRNGVTFTDGVP